MLVALASGVLSCATVRSFLLIFGIGALCAVLAGWLRMAYPLMTWEYAPVVLQHPPTTWLKALWVTGMSEFLWFYWLYLPGLLLYELLVRYVFLRQYSFWGAVVGGGLLGATWYGIVGVFGNFLWQEGAVAFLGPLYTGIGAVFGALHYSWVKRPSKA